MLLDDVTVDEASRIQSGPWDFCFGGGIVDDSVHIVGAEAGCGKSTLFLKMAHAIAAKLQRETCLIATEESKEQIARRKLRLMIPKPSLIRIIPAMGEIVAVEELLLQLKPCMVFLDSLHGLSGESDEVALIIARLMKRVAVKLKSPVLMAGHVNKDGDLAGLEAIRHVIDGVHMMHVEGDTRVWEVEKNRDGRAFISSFYEMTGTGLVHLRDSTPDEDKERLRQEGDEHGST